MDCLHPKVFSGTGIRRDDDQLVVSTPAGIKTLSGASVEMAVQILRLSDGTRSVTNIGEELGSPSAVTEIIDRLRRERILYAYDCIDALGELNPRVEYLVERVFADLSSAECEAFEEVTEDAVVDIYGAQEPLTFAGDALDSLGIDRHDVAPDVVLFSKTSEEESWEPANEQWLANEAVLIRGQYEPSQIEIGPVLSPDAPACLNCLRTRADLNSDREQYSYEQLATSRSTHRDWYGGHLLSLVLRALTRTLPEHIVNHVYIINLDSMITRQTRVFGLPGCTYCDD